MKWIAAIALALALTACGGGGDSDDKCTNRDTVNGVTYVTPC